MAVDHLRAGRRRRLSQDYFPQAVAIGHREEARGGPGTDVAVSWGDTYRARVSLEKTERWERLCTCLF